eukprot:gene6822-biopygen2414
MGVTNHLRHAATNRSEAVTNRSDAVPNRSDAIPNRSDAIPSQSDAAGEVPAARLTERVPIRLRCDVQRGGHRPHKTAEAAKGCTVWTRAGGAACGGGSGEEMGTGDTALAFEAHPGTLNQHIRMSIASDQPVSKMGAGDPRRVLCALWESSVGILCGNPLWRGRRCIDEGSAAKRGQERRQRREERRGEEGRGVDLSSLKGPGQFRTFPGLFQTSCLSGALRSPGSYRTFSGLFRTFPTFLDFFRTCRGEEGRGQAEERQRSGRERKGEERCGDRSLPRRWREFSRRRCLGKDGVIPVQYGASSRNHSGEIRRVTTLP